MPTAGFSISVLVLSRLREEKTKAVLAPDSSVPVSLLNSFSNPASPTAASAQVPGSLSYGGNGVPFSKRGQSGSLIPTSLASPCTRPEAMRAYKGKPGEWATLAHYHVSQTGQAP